MKRISLSLVISSLLLAACAPVVRAPSTYEANDMAGASHTPEQTRALLVNRVWEYDMASGGVYNFMRFFRDDGRMFACLHGQNLKTFKDFKTVWTKAKWSVTADQAYGTKIVFDQGDDADRAYVPVINADGTKMRTMWPNGETGGAMRYAYGNGVLKTEWPEWVDKICPTVRKAALTRP